MTRLVTVSEAIVTPPGPEARLADILFGLRHIATGVLGAAIADRNGLPIASSFGGGSGASIMTITAMSTMAVQSCSSVLESLGLHPLDTVIMEGKGAVVLVRVLANGFSLLVMLERTTNVGLVRLEMERTAREIEDVLVL